VIVDVNDDRFNAYVDGRADGAVARGAAPIADAGAQISSSRQSFYNNRRLG